MDGISRKLLERMALHHRQGSFGERVDELAVEISVSPEDVRLAVLSLKRAGMLDDVEEVDLVCLSALGLRVAMEAQEAPVVAADEAAGLRPPDLRKLAVCLMELPEVWQMTVENSPLGDDEKDSLIKLGGNLFAHPAAASLLARALDELGLKVHAPE